MRYAVHVVPDTVGYMATCRDLPEFIAAAETVDATLENAVEILETTLGIYIDERRRIPTPSSIQEGEQLVAVPLSTALKALLSNQLLDQGWRKADLARAMGVHAPQVDRLLDVNHKSKLAAIERAFDTMHRRVEVEVEVA
ncbi:type II toxin-antitoxin system HicB family antitoxin [Halomonas organivorans]|uniref:Antitoxin HicB n=1 Tax=Halomonas organivorans TaxID=257772 RepID=A0A7W5C1U5_9GAMM|nr:type II toxin-antitoxin system HicB family antitoxin [Halomonas organivorans]MBB3142809.1 antitoxin HicB [Halomonas organivorans]